MFYFIFLVLFVSGCAIAAANKPTPEPEPLPPEPEPEPVPAPPPERKRYGVSFAVDPTDERLMAAFTAGADAWNKALGGEWVTVSNNGEVPVFWVDIVEGEGCTPKENIPEGKYEAGCAVSVGTTNTHVELSTMITDDARLHGIVLHEMGHTIRAAGGHIDSPGSPFPFNENNIMNHTGNSAAMITPTADDVAFVWQGMRYDYTQNLPQPPQEG